MPIIGGSGGGTAGSFTLLGTSTLGSSAAQIAVSGIPAGYMALLVTALLRTDRANATDGVRVFFNADTTAANYIYGITQYIAGGGTTSQGDNWLGASAATAPAGCFGSNRLMVGGYDTTDYIAAFDILSEMGLSGGIFQVVGGASWNSTAVVSTITLKPVTGPNFVAKSRMAVYGLAAQ
jgi:hypothetical protein